MRFDFHFGKKKKTIWDYAFWSIVLFSLVGFLSSRLNINESTIWLWIDKIQRELIRKNILPLDNPANEIIIKTPELLDNRVKNDVRDAIRRYEDSLPPEPPRMTNKDILKEMQSPRYSDTQRVVVKDAIYYECPGGVMGIRGVWVPNDPECVDK